jgi:peptidoglycan/xylan/chitin deacetylase (PgdA/CDA1 family)
MRRVLPLALACLFSGAMGATAHAAPTVVSFTFDDGQATAYAARSILSAHNMHGTFYLNSAEVGTSDFFMTWPQIADLASDGNEIGGHTLNHVVLPGLPDAEARRQVCDDRAALQAHGYNAVSFAYPEIEYDAATQQIVRDCGYQNARAGDASYPPAETIPPADPYAIRTVPSIDSSTTVQDMKDYVTTVEQNGGGWVIFLLHAVCSGCADFHRIAPADLEAITSWLQPRAADGTVVKTVQEVMQGADTTPPSSSIACNSSACSSSPYTTTPVTISLSATDDRSPAPGITLRYTTDGSDPAVNGLPYSGPFSITATTTVRWFATDSAGNAEAARSQTITVQPAQNNDHTIVSLTFDDGTASEYWARDELRTRGMRGTFYINSARVGTSGYYMTWPQIQDLYADGNEIGGHTSSHANLRDSDPNEAKREICTDRQTLLAHGYAVTNLAYPFGAFDASVKQMAHDCGYNSARTTASTTAEGMPPADPYAIRVGSGSGDLQTLKNAVIAAEQAGGGWVPIVFHQICNACDTNWITQSDFTAFLDWLQARAGDGTVVRTVQQVIGGSVEPGVAGPAPPAAPSGSNGLRNASLDYDSDADTAPDCWDFDTFGNNRITWSRTTDAHSGPSAERVDISQYVNGDAKLAVRQDLGLCTPTVTPGRRYVLSAWYKSSAAVRFTAFTRDASGRFDFWQSGPSVAAASGWTRTTWTTPVIPAGVTGLSFGLTLAANGSLTVDDLGLDDASPGGADTVLPSTAVTAPTNGDVVAGSVNFTASASDDRLLDRVDYLVDGTVVGSRFSGPYRFTWDSRSVMNGNHTITTRAYDGAGNARTSTGVVVTVNNSGVNLLQNPSLETASGQTPTCWLLGGFGTNSFTWTRTSDAHTGGFAENLAVSSLTNGDRKMVSAQDAGTCAIPAVPGRTYTFSNFYKVSQMSGLAQPVIFAYYRSSAGAWTYWAQFRLSAQTAWTQSQWVTPPVPAGATHISLGMGLTTAGSVTMDDFVVFDNTPPPDTTPPSSAITCTGPGSSGDTDSTGCISGYYGGPVQVALTATDNPGGGGVGSIRYTTDGTDPTATTGTVYSGPFNVSSTATVKYRAFDKAGNAEAVNSQQIRIDTTPPTSNVTCDLVQCSTGWYQAAVSVRLTATDAGGADVREIRYTTDGTDPTATNGKIFVGRFSVVTTTVVKYRAFDNAGNAEAVNMLLVAVDTTAPTSTIACGDAQTACSTEPYFESVDVYLAGADADSGVQSIRYTTDGSDPTASNGQTYTVPFAVTDTTTVRYRAFDAAGNAEPINTKQIEISTPGATLTAPADGSVVSGDVTISASVTGMSVDHVDFLVDGVVTGTVTQAPYQTTWNSTTVADGPHEIRARVTDTDGGQIDTATANVTVDNAQPDTVAPTSAIRCNGDPCHGAAYSSAVSVTLSATDTGGSGLDQIRYTTDGSTPTKTNGTPYGGAFSVAVTTTVKYRAFDLAGNAEAVNSELITIDSVAPTSSIFCDGAACVNTYVNHAIHVTLAASDTGGSGLDVIRYTTDGTDPSPTNGTTYTDGFDLTSTTTVRYRAYDSAGNAEPINFGIIRVDTRPPASSIACNGGGCATPVKPGVSVSLSATDADSGVNQIRYTLNGTDPTATTGTVYTTAFPLNATTTVKYRAFDKVGNAEAVATQVVQVDGTAPTVSVSAPAAGAAVSGATTLTADANDNLGVDHVDFLVDGTVVGTDGNGPFSTSWDSSAVADGSHAVTAKAFDAAGNSTTSSAVNVIAINGTNLLSNPSLETASGATPTCWLLGGFGTNTFAWTRSTDAHSGGFAEGLSVTAFTNGDRKMVSAQDTGACAPAGTPGRTYTVTGWYKSAARPVIYAYYRSSAGAWTYWAQSPSLAPSSSYVRAVWTTPALPAGATAVSVGMGLASTGSVTMDDFGLFRNG